VGITVREEDGVTGVELDLGDALAADPAAARRHDVVGHQMLGLG
jgi:hypothetical protein